MVTRAWYYLVLGIAYHIECLESQIWFPSPLTKVPDFQVPQKAQLLSLNNFLVHAPQGENQLRVWTPTAQATPIALTDPAQHLTKTQGSNQIAITTTAGQVQLFDGKDVSIFATITEDVSSASDFAFVCVNSDQTKTIILTNNGTEASLTAVHFDTPSQQPVEVVVLAEEFTQVAVYNHFDSCVVVWSGPATTLTVQVLDMSNYGADYNSADTFTFPSQGGSGPNSLAVYFDGLWLFVVEAIDSGLTLHTFTLTLHTVDTATFERVHHNEEQEGSAAAGGIQVVATMGVGPLYNPVLLPTTTGNTKTLLLFAVDQSNKYLEMYTVVGDTARSPPVTVQPVLQLSFPTTTTGTADLEILQAHISQQQQPVVVDGSGVGSSVDEPSRLLSVFMCGQQSAQTEEGLDALVCYHTHLSAKDDSENEDHPSSTVTLTTTPTATTASDQPPSRAPLSPTTATLPPTTTNAPPSPPLPPTAVPTTPLPVVPPVVVASPTVTSPPPPSSSSPTPPTTTYLPYSLFVLSSIITLPTQYTGSRCCVRVISVVVPNTNNNNNNQNSKGQAGTTRKAATSGPTYIVTWETSYSTNSTTTQSAVVLYAQLWSFFSDRPLQQPTAVALLKAPTSAYTILPIRTFPPEITQTQPQVAQQQPPPTANSGVSSSRSQYWAVVVVDVSAVDENTYTLHLSFQILDYSRVIRPFGEKILSSYNISGSQNILSNSSGGIQVEVAEVAQYRISIIVYGRDMMAVLFVVDIYQKAVLYIHTYQKMYARLLSMVGLPKDEQAVLWVGSEAAPTTPQKEEVEVHGRVDHVGRAQITVENTLKLHTPQGTLQGAGSEKGVSCGLGNNLIIAVWTTGPELWSSILVQTFDAEYGIPMGGSVVFRAPQFANSGNGGRVHSLTVVSNNDWFVIGWVEQSPPELPAGHLWVQLGVIYHNTVLTSGDPIQLSLLPSVVHVKLAIADDIVSAVWSDINGGLHSMRLSNTTHEAYYTAIQVVLLLEESYFTPTTAPTDDTSDTTSSDEPTTPEQTNDEIQAASTNSQESRVLSLTNDIYRKDDVAKIIANIRMLFSERQIYTEVVDVRGSQSDQTVSVTIVDMLSTTNNTKLRAEICALMWLLSSSPPHAAVSRLSLPPILSMSLVNTTTTPTTTTLPTNHTVVIFTSSSCPAKSPSQVLAVDIDDDSVVQEHHKHQYSVIVGAGIGGLCFVSLLFAIIGYVIVYKITEKRNLPEPKPIPIMLSQPELNISHTPQHGTPMAIRSPPTTVTAPGGGGGRPTTTMPSGVGPAATTQLAKTGGAACWSSASIPMVESDDEKKTDDTIET